MKYLKSSLSILAVAFFSFVLSFLPTNQKNTKEAVELNSGEKGGLSKKELVSQLGLDKVPSYSDIKQYLKTGDIILFQEYSLSGMEIILLEEVAEDVPGYTHVGVIFDLPAHDGLPAGLYFWQAIPPKDILDVNYGVDYFKGVVSDGAQMVSLDTLMDCLETLRGDDTMYATLRQLTTALSDEEQLALENYARQVVGRSFSYPIPKNMVEDYFRGQVEKKQTSDYTFFCSKLASQTFMMAGLIDTVITNGILPGHFAISPGDKHNRISFKTNSLDSLIQILPD